MALRVCMVTPYAWSKPHPVNEHVEGAADELDPQKPFERYGMEQQGQIVEDCYRGSAEAAAISPYRPSWRLTSLATPGRDLR